MDTKKAQELLQSDDSHSRLIAARFFEKSGKIGDADLITAALAREDVSRIKRVLSKTLNRLSESAAALSSTQSEQIELADEIYSRALRETTRILLHELRPIIGSLIQRAKQEIPNYDSSRTSHQVTRLMSLLDGFDRLAKAASTAKYEEFDLADLIRDISNIVKSGDDIRIEQIGPVPLIVAGDRSLAYMVISNGLRNAAEATLSVTRQEPPKVVLTWGETDVDYWVSIVDWGPGLPIGSDQIWQIGTTNKKDHLGMGLAIAEQAASSLQGTITLNPRAEGGVAFEFRWVSTRLKRDENSGNRR